MPPDPLPTPTLDYGRPGRPVQRFSVVRVVVAVVVIGGLLSLLLDTGPSRHTRRLALEVKCGSNLRQIGVGIGLYCRDHGGRYPDSLSELLAAEQMPGVEVVCPASADTPAAFPSTSPTAAEVAAALAVPGHVSYVYVGRGLTTATATATTVVAYEPVSNHGDGCHVLYGDGSVMWYTAQQAAALPVPATTTRPTPPF